MAALREALHVMGMLEEISQEPNPKKDALSLYAFPSLWWQITKAMLDHEQQTHVHPCTRCSPSGVFIAFDLVASAVFAKAYWLLPSCHPTSSLLTSVEKILQIAAHISAHPDILQPRMVSTDATRYPTPRVKVYVRRLFNASNTFQDIEPHLSLGGRIPLSETFWQSCERLWSSLVGPDDAVPGIGPKYTLLLYDLPTGAPGEPLEKEVSAKLYIMCQEIPRVDSFVAKKLYQDCPVLRDAKLVKELAASAEPTAFICEIGLVPGKSETEVTVYCSPCWWSRKTWKDCVEKDGRLKKVRRVIAPR